MRQSIVFTILQCTLLAHNTFADIPDIIWTTNPVIQNSTALSFFTNVSGTGSNEGSVYVELIASNNTTVRPCILHSDNTSVAFSLPEKWPTGVYSYRVCLRSGVCSKTWQKINKANCMWAQGDRGFQVTRGQPGALRIFGRSLAFQGGKCQDSHKLHEVQGVSVRFTLEESLGTGSRADRTVFIVNTTIYGSCYDLSLQIPDHVPLGNYSVQVKNNLPNADFEACDTTRLIEVVDPGAWPRKSFAVDEAPYYGNITKALLAAGDNGGGRVVLEAGKIYDISSDTVLYIPNLVTLVSSSTHANTARDRAIIRWKKAAPRLPGSPKVCTGPTSFSGWEAVCPPLVYGDRQFAIENVHIKAPATSALVGIMSPSKRAKILNSTLEVIGTEESTAGTSLVNVSNALWIGNASSFIVAGCNIFHIAEGAPRPGGEYGGHDTPAPCGQHSPNNYGFFFTEGAHDGIFFNNSVVLGCNGWGTQSSANMIVESNDFRSVGLNGLEGSGFSSASTVPRARKNVFLRNSVTGTNAATGKHHPDPENPWSQAMNYGPKADPLNPLETLTSDGSYGGYFGAAVNSAGTSITLASRVRPNPMNANKQRERGGWKQAAIVVIAGKGLGQVRTVTSNSENDTVVTINRPLTTQLDETSMVTIAPWVGQWIVAGNTFANGTSVQTFGITLHAIFADNELHNMTRSAQVDPSGICLTSLQYGSGVMPNIFFEITNNNQFYSEGIHLRGNAVNGTTLTYGFSIRGNKHIKPPPLEYLQDTALGLESGSQISVSGGCKSGVVEGNSVDNPYKHEGISNNQTIRVDPMAFGVVQRCNSVT